jgi:photosystem II stability/assembly factor-like uncharacterized protein
MTNRRWTLIAALVALLLQGHTSWACDGGRYCRGSSSCVPDEAPADTSPPRLYDGGWGYPRSSEVNDGNADCFPWRSGDGRYLLFASIDLNGPARPGHVGSWDIYISEWDSLQHHWKMPQNISANINTRFDERRPSCNFACDTLYFHRKGLSRSHDIFMSARDGQEWALPCSLSFPINTEAHEEHPAISPDGRRLYFTSDRDGGYGGKDIWVAVRSGASWDSVYNIGPPINTLNEETRPFESFDGQRFYFSNQHGEPRAEGSYGGPGDIYVSTWTGSGWGDVHLVTAPVNNDLVACSPVESFDGSEIWFGSEAWEGARGDEDIWVATRDEMWPPLPAQGYGDWQKTGELGNAIYVYDLEEGPGGVIYAATACADMGPTGKVFRTIDGGETWTACADLPGAMVIYSIAIDGEIVYAGTYPNGDVFKSADGGASWVNTANIPGATSVRAMERLQNGDILVGTSPHGLTHRNSIFRMTAGGSTWAETAALRHINPCKFIRQTSSGSLFAGGWGYDSEIFIHRSYDNGATWDSLTVISEFEPDWTADGFYESTSGTLYVSGWIPGKGTGTGGGFVYKSSNDGTTWTACEKIVRADGFHNCRTYAITEDQHGTVYVGMQPARDFVVYASSDTGRSWYSTGGLDGAFECLSLLRASDGRIYAGTTPNGDVFAYTPPVGIEEGAGVPQTTSRLLQNRPNPFTARTTIEFTIPRGSSGPAVLQIYDASGKRVRKLLDMAHARGPHTVVWDGKDGAGRDMPSGIYFCRLGINGVSCTRKMVLAR